MCYENGTVCSAIAKIIILVFYRIFDSTRPLTWMNFEVKTSFKFCVSSCQKVANFEQKCDEKLVSVTLVSTLPTSAELVFELARWKTKLDAMQNMYLRNLQGKLDVSIPFSLIISNEAYARQ